MQTTIPTFLTTKISSLRAIYLFGSRSTGAHRHDSDVDLAILTDYADRADSKTLFDLAIDLSLLLRKEVDLVDIRNVTLDFKYIILSTSKRIYCQEKVFCDSFEMTTYSMYQRFELERRDIIEAIKQRGYIHG